MHDAMTLAIGHHDYERKKILVDLLRAWESPFDPHKVTQEISEICKRYRVHRITGDRYAGEWVSEASAKHGITYQKSELSKSKLYLELEAGLNTRQVEFPKNKKLIDELLSLERRTGRSGRESIDHPPAPGSSDDRSNVLAGVYYLLKSLENSAFQGCDLT